VTAWTTRLGTLLAIATLALTPAVRVVCLAMCASPAGVARASVDAPRIDRALPAQPAYHAHHHPRAAAGAEAPAASATAGASTVASRDMRCDVARHGGCGDACGLVPLPAGRTPAADAAIAPPLSQVAMADLASWGRVATRLIRVPPPGPPPASTPLRI
jgi:hypothetical protein